MHQLAEGIGRERPREVEALGQVAPQAPDLLDLGQRLDPLDDGRRTDRLGQRDHRGHDGGLDRVLVDVAHEAAVDLDDVDGKPGQVPERGMARAEVVDREPDTQLVESVQDRRRQLHVVHGQALRDLETQLRWVDARDVEHLRDLLREVRLLELEGREVDADTQAHPAAVQPSLGAPARPLEHRPADLQDGAVVLRQFHEVRRRQDPVLRVVPTHQRLGRHDAPVLERHERLEVDVDLLALHRVMEGGIEIEPAGRASTHPIVVEERDATAAPSLLGLVHRDIGIVQEVVAGAPDRADRHADAHRRHDLLVTGQRHRLPQRVQHPVGHLGGVVRRGHALQDHDELVTAEPRQRVAGAYGTAEPLGHDAEQLVPDLVSEVVVDDLELVDVPEEHGHAGPGAIGLRQRVVEVIEQEATVGQSRQGILEGVPRQLLLERPALRRVPEDDHRPRAPRPPRPARRSC